MNTKIVGGVAIGIISLVAATIGGIFYLQGKKEIPAVAPQQQAQPAATSQQPSTQQQSASQKQASEPVQNNSQPQLSQQQNQPSTSCNLAPKDGYVRINGKVIFPKGIKNPEKYQVAVKMTNKFPLASDGTFCAYADKYASMLSVSSGGAEDFPLLYFVVGNKDKDIVVDAQSTAVGMVYTSGVILLATDDSNKAIADLTKISKNVAVKKLAQEIQNKDVLYSKDIEAGSIATAFEVASKSAIDEIVK